MNLRNVIEKEKAEEATAELLTANSMMGDIEKDFVRSFGIGPDSLYYHEGLKRVVVVSGDLEVVRCTAGNEFSTAEWAGVATCKTCGEKIIATDWGFKSAKYISFDVPYWHKHEPGVISQLRDLLKSILELE